MQGKVGTIVAKDCADSPMDQVVAAPHRSKIHFIHAMATAARELSGGGAVRLYIEDLGRRAKSSSAFDDVWPPWSLCRDALDYYDEMGLLDVSVEKFVGDRHLRYVAYNDYWILLDSAGLERSNWPTAVQYAASQQRAEQLGALPRMPVAYGARVYVKTKRYKTGAVEDFGPHWTRGRYVGPSTDIRTGHVILKDSGTFIQTTHVRVTKDPPLLDEVVPTVVVESEDVAKDHEDEPPLPPPLLPPPLRRVRAKRPVIKRADGFFPDYEVLYDVPRDDDSYEEGEAHVKYLRLGEIQYVERTAQQLCQEDKFSEVDAARLLALVAGTCGNLRVPRATGGKGMVLGAYVHGGAFGVTRYGRDLPWVASYFNYYLRRRLEQSWPSMDYSWTTLALQAAEEVPKHKDSHNQRGTYNYVSEIRTESTEGLWVQDRGHEHQVVGGTSPEDFQYEGTDGKTYDGCLVDVTSQPAVFDPLVPHAYVRGNDDVEGATANGNEATVWDWGIYVETELEEESVPSGQAVYLRRVCSSDDPGAELLKMKVAPNSFEEDNTAAHYQEDVAENVEYWASLGLYESPSIAKLEPEYVEGIEAIIANAVQT
ncbi:unnamed protein product, partial [Symbiodinium sp. CCMP2456]